MKLANPLEILRDAKIRKYAVPAFNIHNLETIQAVVEIAAEEKSPVIIQTTPGTLKHAGMEYVAAIVKAAAEKYNIPIALHMDHCTSYETLVQCVQAGYSSIMIDSAHLVYDENIVMCKKVVEMAHAAGVMVEGELGKIGGTEDDMTVDEKEATFTVPEEAEEFVKSTGLDTLAIAIGTAHGVYKGDPKLDFIRLEAINNVVDIPLVLHGASGVSDESIKKAIKLGICKINIATELKIPMANAIKKVFEDKPSENDPRNYMGMAREAVKKVVRDKIRLCGSNGKA